MRNKDLHVFSDLNHRDTRYFRSIPVSYGSIRPGDLIVFKYNLEEEGIKAYYPRLCLVVKNQLGTVGYTSLRGNHLLSCFRLNDAPLVVVKYIILTLHKNKNKCSYDIIQRGLNALLGTVNYRTYMLRRIEDFQLFNPDKSKIGTEEES